MTIRKNRMRLVGFKWLRRLFAGVATLCVAAIAMVMLAAGGVMLFSVATGSEADKSRLVRTAPAAFIAPAVAASSSPTKPAVPAVAASSSTTKPAVPSVAKVVNRRPVTDGLDRREQPVAEVVDRREQPPKKTVKQKPTPKFAQQRPSYSHPLGALFHFR
jgi:hypothetical protein